MKRLFQRWLGIQAVELPQPQTGEILRLIAENDKLQQQIRDLQIDLARAKNQGTRATKTFAEFRAAVEPQGDAS